LIAGTTYYYRAYATNTIGTGYGEQKLVIISNIAALPSTTIGSQIWSTANLNVAKYRNGDLIPNVTDVNQWANLTTGAWCWYNNDSATYAATYGRLYNWYAVNDPRGLAPQGWHVPSNAEWATLETTVGGSSIAGGALKSTTGWIAPNTGATNSSGFSALPGGYRYSSPNAIFQQIGYIGLWWCAFQSRSHYMYNNDTYSGESAISDRSAGLSVRVVKD
jgi:uncharacterized protein (TIGR02145 family)